MDDPNRIALFPLGVVLFPTSRIPLHIFEERYKRLCASALEHGTVFGINFMEEEHLHTAGCTAHIIEVTSKYPDGTMDIITEGVRRYEIVRLEQGTPSTLSYATVKWIDDIEERRDARLTIEAIELFNDLCDLAYDGAVEALDVELWSSLDKLPSFAIAQKSGLLPEQRQKLLLVKSENARLKLLRDHLTTLIPKLKEVEAIQELIRNDGYIVTWNKKS